MEMQERLEFCIDIVNVSENSRFIFSTAYSINFFTKKSIDHKALKIEEFRAKRIFRVVMIMKILNKIFIKIS